MKSIVVDLLGVAVGFAVAVFMLYFPYTWCKRRGESEEAYGLRWVMGQKAWRDTIFATLLTLLPLTFISFYWPSDWGRGGPFHPDLWLTLDMLGGGLAAAFIEETFYRGWLQTLFTRRWGPWVAIPLVSLLFALSHLFVAPSWLRIATFFPGLVMGALRHRNGSILPAIIYHAVCNIWAVWWAPR
ncbi:MAG: CPBP family intramembrane metalloprotease [Synergistaceae bacterium]|jgi:membrane protease YdiL (CAAX protease family)|nr:CPBP family intramembrane metalloprotease [Synergistaceae bacterium]